MAKLIVGCGYLGRRVAERWRNAGQEVWTLVRSETHAEELRRAGFQALAADITQPASLATLPECDTALFAAGYNPRSGGSRRSVYVDGLANVLAALRPGVRRVIHISSTGVYGQTDGRWVDESTPCQPRREGGAAFLAAEQLLAGQAWAARAVTLRLAGLYGPGRIPLKADLLAGRPIAVPVHVYLNLIHVDDAAAVVLAAEQARTPALYNVADGQPVLRRQYYQCLAELLHVAGVAFVDPPPGAPISPRSDSNKRIGNARLMAELGVTLQYPSYREGLAAIVAAEREAVDGGR
jgi:nucleoside-diphosphate-sugar epimerase